MTPAERARLIDKQEFEAECRAVRQRVYARLGIKQAEDRARVRRSMVIPVERGHFKRPVEAPAPERKERPPNCSEPRMLSYRGETRSLSDWAAQLGISPRTIHSRLRYGWPVERVLSARVQNVGKRTHRSNR